MKILIYFPDLRHFHMHKDIGKILIHLRLNSDVEFCELATNKNGPKIEDTIRLDLVSLVIKIKKYEILILYHFTMTSLLIAILARIRNRNIKLVLKSDIDTRYLRYLSNSKLKIVFRVFETLFDLILVETKQHVAQLAYHLKNKDKAFLLYNGSKLSPSIVQDEKIQKKNEALFVGRLGHVQKNIPYLLDVLDRYDKIPRLDGITLMGDIDGPNKLAIEKLLRNLRKKYSVRVISTTDDNKQLAREYKRAKVVLLPSLYESYGLVTAEAVTQGTKVISHEVGISADLAKWSHCVDIVELNNDSMWLEKISIALEQVDHEYPDQDTCDLFDWLKIGTILKNKLKSLL